MSTLIQPAFTGFASLSGLSGSLNPYSVSLARGSRVRGVTSGLGSALAGSQATKWGAYLHVALGRTGTTALDVGIKVLVNPLGYDQANAINLRQPSPYRLQGSTSAAVTTSVNADTALAATLLNVSSSASFSIDDGIILAPGTAREEWHRIASKPSGSTLQLYAPLLYAHTAAQADALYNQADVFDRIWLPGGEEYEIVISYDAATTGDTCRVRAWLTDLDTINFG